MSSDPEFLKSSINNFNNIIFDLDDTIYMQDDFDRLAFVDIAWKLLGKSDEDECVRFADRLLRQKKARGRHYGHLFDDAFAWVARPKLTVAECVELYRRHDARGLSAERSLAGTIAVLHAGGKRVFVVTNGHRPTQLRKIQKLDLERWLTGIYVGDPSDPSTPLKPDPAAYRHFTRVHDIERAVMVGDDEGIDGGFANNCGIPFIRFHFGEVR